MVNAKKAGYQYVTDPMIGLVLLPFVPFLELAALIRWAKGKENNVRIKKPWRPFAASALAFLYAATQGFVMWVLFRGILDTFTTNASALVTGLNAGIYAGSTFWVNYDLANKFLTGLQATPNESGQQQQQAYHKLARTILFGALCLAAICAAVLTSALLYTTIQAHPLSSNGFFAGILPAIAASVTMVISTVLYVSSAWSFSKEQTVKRQRAVTSSRWSQLTNWVKNNKLKIILGILVITGMAFTSFAGVGPVHDVFVKIKFETLGSHVLSSAAAIMCFLGEIAFALGSIDRLGNTLMILWSSGWDVLRSMSPIAFDKEGRFDPSKSFDRVLFIAKVVVLSLTVVGVLHTAGIAPLVISAVFMAIPAIKSIYKKMRSSDTVAVTAGPTLKVDSLPSNTRIKQNYASTHEQVIEELVGKQPPVPVFRFSLMNGFSNGALGASAFPSNSPLYAPVLLFGAVTSAALTAPKVESHEQVRSTVSENRKVEYSGL